MKENKKEPRKNIICFGNLRSGVGKTTLTALTATAWANQGLRVLAVDLDPQGNLTRILDQKNYEKGYALTIYNDLTDGEPVSILKTNNENLDLYPANLDLHKLNYATTENKQKNTLLLSLLNQIRDEYDRIVIDTPAQSGILCESAILAKDFIVLVATPDESSFDGISMLVDTWKNANLPPGQGVIVINRSQKGDNNDKFLEMLCKFFKADKDMILEPFIENYPKVSPNDIPQKIYDLAAVIDTRMQPQETKSYKRTTILVEPEQYKKLKAYAIKKGTTVSALMNNAMKRILEESRANEKKSPTRPTQD